MVAGPAYPHPIPRPPSAGAGCECFLEHKTVALDVPLNNYTPVAAWDATVTCGVRPSNLLATTMLVVEWRVLIQDYSDDSFPPFPIIQFGYGVYVSQAGFFLAGSHGFINWDSTSSQGWQADVANLPDDPAWPDALTSGSFTVPLNVAQHGFPDPWDHEVAAVLGIWDGGVIDATFHIETYEYALCGCECQE